jgi:hypothetical protein
MISHASELLRAFISVEESKLNGFKMIHMPTLGKAYEAITMAGIDKRFVLPSGLDLRVVSGFIEGSQNQFDCMLVQGAGERYGLTNEYRYPIDRVLCVFEVKKGLTKTELADAINHLADVQKLHLDATYGERYERPFSSIRGAVRSYERITGRIGPESYRALDAMPLQERALIGYLERQRHAPVTVVLGYDGYRTECGLRGALLKIMEGEVTKATNTSIDLLPTLMTSGDFSIVKCNAQPYLVHREENGWIAAASTRHNAALILLELLWTKISSFCNVKMPFGEDMETETLVELFALQALPHGDTFGWHVTTFEYQEARLDRPQSTPWRPARVSPAAMTLAKQVAVVGGATTLDKKLGAHLEKAHGVSLDAAVAELTQGDGFARSGDVLKVTSEATFLAMLDDGSGYLAVDRDKLGKWCAAQGLNPTIMTILNL